MWHERLYMREEENDVEGHKVASRGKESEDGEEEHLRGGATGRAERDLVGRGANKASVAGGSSAEEHGSAVR